MKAKGESGKPLTANPPFGYVKDANDKNLWIVDEEAAAVVKKIFALCLDGYEPSQTATILTKAKVLTPTAYYHKKGISATHSKPDNPYKWSTQTVSDILERQAYIGNTVNFTTYKPSYKSKRFVKNPAEKQMVFENTHEAIIDIDTWEKVQELRKNKRRPSKTGKTNMFSGVAYCADCGKRLYYCTTKYFESRQDHFVCSTSRTHGKEACDTHFIRAIVLEKGVLAHLRYVISFVASYENQFREIIGAKKKSDVQKELSSKKRQIAKYEKRVLELDGLFKRIYEDNVKGKLSDSRFELLSADYEKEQALLTETVKNLSAEIERTEEQTDNVERFIAKVHKYFDLQELTPSTLNDLVKRVEVHQSEKIDGKRTQLIDIHYDLVGLLPLSLFQQQTKNDIA